MRTAAVVIPICTIAAAAALTAFQLRCHPRAHMARPPAVVTTPTPVVIQPPPRAAAPPKYGEPVGDQFLGAWRDLLLTTNDSPPLLFLLGASDLDGYRYGWRMPRVAHAMAEELAAVLDDGCAAGCSPIADAARTATHAFIDGDATDDPARTRSWDTDDAGITEHWHRLAIRSRVGALVLDVTCDCASETVGMRMWNDVTTCDATLRDHGRTIATYRPRVRMAETKESILEPTGAYDQTVELPGGASLVTETGSGPHWR